MKKIKHVISPTVDMVAMVIYMLIISGNQYASILVTHMQTKNTVQLCTADIICISVFQQVKYCDIIASGFIIVFTIRHIINNNFIIRMKNGIQLWRYLFKNIVTTSLVCAIYRIVSLLVMGLIFGETLATNWDIKESLMYHITYSVVAQPTSVWLILLTGLLVAFLINILIGTIIILGWVISNKFITGYIVLLIMVALSNLSIEVGNDVIAKLLNILSCFAYYKNDIRVLYSEGIPYMKLLMIPIAYIVVNVIISNIAIKNKEYL